MSDDYVECGIAVIDAYVGSNVDRTIRCCRSEHILNSLLSHLTALLIASVSDLGSLGKVRSKSFTSL